MRVLGQAARLFAAGVAAARALVEGDRRPVPPIDPPDVHGRIRRAYVAGFEAGVEETVMHLLDAPSAVGVAYTGPLPVELRAYLETFYAKAAA